MTTPIELTSWACSFCKNLYPHNEPGKKMAAECCKCRKCGEAPTTYTGLGGICKHCHVEDTLAAAEKSAKTAQEQLGVALRDAERFRAMPKRSTPR